MCRCVRSLRANQRSLRWRLSRIGFESSVISCKRRTISAHTRATAARRGRKIKTERNAANLDPCQTRLVRNTTGLTLTNFPMEKDEKLSKYPKESACIVPVYACSTCFLELSLSLIWFIVYFKQYSESESVSRRKKKKKRSRSESPAPTHDDSGIPLPHPSPSSPWLHILQFCHGA